jgi:Domain of unknown function (DUF4286)
MALSYEVTVDVREDLTVAFERYMRGHIPDVLATGCFLSARLDQLSATRFRTSYRAKERADLDRYLAEHASALRADFMAHFPEGCTPSREIWEALDTWVSEVH